MTIALPLLVAWAGGAIGIPRNDDFSYLGILFRWGESGHLRFDNWPAMTLVGQLVLARPVTAITGSSVTALQFLTVAVGAGGVAAMYHQLCRVTSRSVAVVACMTLVVGPLWASLAASFLTDVWAFMAIAVCLLLGSRAVEARGDARIALLAASAGAGLVATSIRESGLLAAVAVLGVAAWSYFHRDDDAAPGEVGSGWRARDGYLLTLIVAVLIGATLLLLMWRSSIPFAGLASLKTTGSALGDVGSLDVGSRVVDPALESLFTLSLLVLPATVLVSGVRVFRGIARQHRGVALGAAVVAGVLSLTASLRGPLGNYVVPRLGPNMSVGLQSDRMSTIAWTAVSVLVAYSTFVMVLCVGAVVARRFGPSRPAPARSSNATRHARWILGVYGTASAALLLVSTPLGQAVYDRHLLPVVPLVAAFVLTVGELRLPARRRFGLSAAVVLGAFALLGLVFTTSSAVLDHTRWRAASELVDAGFDPLTVDGGLDWVGFHSDEPLRRRENADPQNSWWAAAYRDFRPCVVVVPPDWAPGDEYHDEPIRVWVTGLPFGEHVVLRAFQRNDCAATRPVGH